MTSIFASILLVIAGLSAPLSIAAPTPSPFCPALINKLSQHLGMGTLALPTKGGKVTITDNNSTLTFTSAVTGIQITAKVIGTNGNNYRTLEIANNAVGMKHSIGVYARANCEIFNLYQDNEVTNGKGLKIPVHNDYTYEELKQNSERYQFYMKKAEILAKIYGGDLETQRSTSRMEFRQEVGNEADDKYTAYNKIASVLGLVPAIITGRQK
jgi:hypothetical protein